MSVSPRHLVEYHCEQSTALATLFLALAIKMAKEKEMLGNFILVLVTWFVVVVYLVYAIVEDEDVDGCQTKREGVSYFGRVGVSYRIVRGDSL